MRGSSTVDDEDLEAVPHDEYSWAEMGRTVEVSVNIPGQGLHEITREIVRAVESTQVEGGLCTLYIPHTSASLTVQENADPSARRDLERFFDRIAPDGDPLYEHGAEGPDDMAAHIRSALTRTSETFLVEDGALVLGTWQGVYLFEHRRAPHERTLELLISAVSTKRNVV